MAAKYIYETHLHTKESSACARSSGADYIDEYMKRGYDGIIVTDHFYHGNTGVPRELPWKEWVESFCLGYENAKAEGDKKGFKVFFGWEENFMGDEYLIYGLDKEWLINHPEMLEWNQSEQYRQIHAAGGLVVQAHPFRERYYIQAVHLHPFQADAVEIHNAGNQAYQDVLAAGFAEKLGLVTTSGSDMHNIADMDNAMGGMIFDKPLDSIMDFVEAVKSGEGFAPILHPERMKWRDGYSTHLPVMLYDDNGKASEYDISGILEHCSGQ